MNRQCVSATSFARHIFKTYQSSTVLTKKIKLNKYQNEVANRCIRDILKVAKFERTNQPEGNSEMEVTYNRSHSLRVDNLLSMIQEASVIDLDKKILGDFVRTKARDILDRANITATTIILDDAIVVAGDSKMKVVDDLQKLLSGLTVSEINMPHPICKSVLVGKKGIKIDKLKNQYPGVFTGFSDDSSKMFIVSRTPDQAEGLAKIIHKEIEEFAFEIIEKPKFLKIFTHPVDFAAHNYISGFRFQEVTTNDKETDTWLVYGQKEAVQKYVDHFNQQKELVGEIGEMECPANDYTVWHKMLAVAMEAPDTVKCIYNPNLAGRPGKIQVLGPSESVEDVVADLKRVVETSSEEVETRWAPVSATVEPFSFTELKLLEHYPFPNVKTSVDPADKCLSIYGTTRNVASVNLAKEYYENLLKVFEVNAFEVMRSQYKYLKENRVSIMPEISRICANCKVRFEMPLKDNTKLFRLKGLPEDIKEARLNIERHFIINHKENLSNFFVTSSEERLHYETVAVDHLKIPAIFAKHIGNIKTKNPQVEISTLPGKEGTTQVKLRSPNPQLLERAVNMVTGLMDAIVLQRVELTEECYQIVTLILMSGPGHLLNAVYKDDKDKPKILLSYDKKVAGVNITGRHIDEVTEAGVKLHGFLNSIETSNTVPLPTKKLGDKMEYLKEQIAQNAAEPWDNENPPKNLGILLHQHKNEIVVFGGYGRVDQATTFIAAVLELDNWEEYTLNIEEWPRLDANEAYRVKTLLWATFPRVMVEETVISENGSDCLQLKLAWPRPVEELNPGLINSVMSYLSELQTSTQALKTS